MQILNNYVLIKADKPIEKIGSIYIPETSQVKKNSGEIVGFSKSIKDLEKNDRVFFMEYPLSIQNRNNITYLINEETVVTPYITLNAVERSNELIAVGSKILVRIDKEKQKSNRFRGSLGLMMPDFNNNFDFNNQNGIVVSVGPKVEENIKVGDVALFNQFIEGSENTLIKVLDNGDEIRVVETATGMNYEIYGYYSNEHGEFVSSNNYVFVKEQAKKEWIMDGGVMVERSPDVNKSLNKFTLSHRSNNGVFNAGDVILTRNQSAKVDALDIRYIDAYNVELVLG